MTRLRGLRPMLDVRDVAASIAWYSDVLDPADVLIFGNPIDG